VNIMTMSTVGRFRRNLSYADIQMIEYDKFHFFNFNILEHNAALSCHKTQWFGKCGMIVDRYTWVNSLEYWEHPATKLTRENMKQVAAAEAKDK